MINSDAETDQDLQMLAQAAVTSDIRVLCGSAGLAQALDQTLRLDSTHPPPLRAKHSKGPVLTIVGSRHPQSAKQVKSLVQQGANLICPTSLGQPQENLSIGDDVTNALAVLKQGRHLVISTADVPTVDLNGQIIAERLGLIVEAVLSKTAISGLILTGGDIAMAVCSALQSSALQLDTEIEPGIPLGFLHDGPYAGLPVVTKAGGFGSDAVFTQAVASLEKS